jgi:HlyD family secretion protein
LMARLRLINPSGHTEISTLGIEEQRVDAWFDFIDPLAARQLGDGYAVHLRVLIWQSPSTLQVPTGALFREGESWAVFKVSGDRAVKTRVEIGQRGRTTVEIIGGLVAGDKVITHPSDQISDGTLVEELSTGL